jgi:hypothetical protein
LYEGKFIMALATTQSIWRSGGGDQTRTANCGSMKMAVPFYIANLAATANVVNVSGGSALILPANAVVTDVVISAVGTGSVDLGFTPLINVGPGQTTTLGTNVPQAFLANASTATRVTVDVGATGGGASLGNVANATNLVVVTTKANGVSSGTVTGIIEYYVYDTAVQNV